jgi:hypothetical protein
MKKINKLYCNRERAGELLESWRAGELESWRAGELESWRDLLGISATCKLAVFCFLPCPQILQNYSTSGEDL